MITLPPVVRRIAPREKYVEEATIRSIDGTAMFEVTYIPDVPATVGVVICSSILVEQLTVYRYEVLLARALAAQGVAVHRFHYRGTGHSAGEDNEVSPESMVEDAISAAERMRARTGVTRLGYMGTRWGGIVAAAAAGQDQVSPLVLWEPVVVGERYFRQLVRGRLVREMKDQKPTAMSGSWMKELDEKGKLDILGYALYRDFYYKGRDVCLSPLLRNRKAPVLLVQFGRQSTVHADYAQLRHELAALGVRVDIHFIRDEPAWFFPAYLISSASALINLTVEGLMRNDGKAGT